MPGGCLNSQLTGLVMVLLIEMWVRDQAGPLLKDFVFLYLYVSPKKIHREKKDLIYTCCVKNMVGRISSQSTYLGRA